MDLNLELFPRFTVNIKFTNTLKCKEKLGFSKKKWCALFQTFYAEELELDCPNYYIQFHPLKV